MTDPIKKSRGSGLRNAWQTTKRWLATLGDQLFKLLGLVAVGGFAVQIFIAWQNAPQLRGRIVACPVGRTSQPEIWPVTRSTFTVFMTIGNARDVPVPIIDYEMWVKPKRGKGDPIKLETSYRPKAEVLSLHVPEFKETWDFPYDSTAWLLPYLRKPVTKSNPLVGFVVFLGDSELWDARLRNELESMEVLLLDGFGGEHRLTGRFPEPQRVKASDIRSPYLLPHLIPSVNVIAVGPPRSRPPTPVDPPASLSRP